MSHNAVQLPNLRLKPSVIAVRDACYGPGMFMTQQEAFMEKTVELLSWAAQHHAVFDEAAQPRNPAREARRPKITFKGMTKSRHHPAMELALYKSGRGEYEGLTQEQRDVLYNKRIPQIVGLDTIQRLGTSDNSEVNELLQYIASQQVAP